MHLEVLTNSSLNGVCIKNKTEYKNENRISSRINDFSPVFVYTPFKRKSVLTQFKRKCRVLLYSNFTNLINESTTKLFYSFFIFKLIRST